MVSLSERPLSIFELTQFANAILQEFEHDRPEYLPLAQFHCSTGCRVTELFQSFRWLLSSKTTLTITPQKNNATRIVSLADVGIENEEHFYRLLDDMDRLPKNQYERQFSKAVKIVGLWRCYEGGFLHPSTHFFRHLKIKLLKTQGYDKNFIASWIGEKNPDNLDYYLNSQYFGEV